VPFPESSLNEEAGKLFMENYEEYYRHAKMFTDIYAKLKIEEEPACFDETPQQVKNDG
jgi:hypothetical protein